MRHARTFTVAAVAVLGLLISGYSDAQTVRCTTWNLEWFPNGSANEASAAQQEQRIKEAADVLRPINPDIILLQEVRDYDARDSLRALHRASRVAQRSPVSKARGRAMTSASPDSFGSDSRSKLRKQERRRCKHVQSTSLCVRRKRRARFVAPLTRLPVYA
jgi:endonuclease/exonuclease/phosphatase family metal-dependent hydrolase